jgi:hypothetical protein
MRRFGIANFRDVAQASMIQMFVKWRKKPCARFLARRSIRTMHAHPRFNERAN